MVKSGNSRIYRFLQKSSLEGLKVALIASALVIFSLLLQGNIGLNLADEGYLWYGAIETASGQVPFRDFQSYDPGRYYWSAGWLMLLGKGIISLRISLAIFQSIGLTFGLLSLRRVIRSWLMLVILGFLLLVWMFPRHKSFESSLTMAAVYFAVRLIENPSLRQHFISGVFVGIAAFFGRNHGLYNFAAFFLLILFIWYKSDRTNFISRISSWTAGILVGYSPMLIMMLTVSGFYDVFIDRIKFLIHTRSTNIALPILWPWKFHYSQMKPMEIAEMFSFGMFFVLLPVFYVFGIISSLFSKREQLQSRALFTASVAVGVMYMHPCFSRADLAHLGNGIAPFLTGLLSLPLAFNFNHKKILNTILLLVLLGMTFFTAGMASPYYQKASSPSDFIKYNIAGDHLWIDTWTAWHINIAEEINSRKVSQNEGFMIAPYWPGLYPVLQRKSPIRDIYFLHPQTEQRQKEIIQQLKEKNVNWVFLGDMGQDGQDDLRFRNTHKLLWQHFTNHFEPIRMRRLPPDYMLLHRKSSGEQSVR